MESQRRLRDTSRCHEVVAAVALGWVVGGPWQAGVSGSVFQNFSHRPFGGKWAFLLPTVYYSWKRISLVVLFKKKGRNIIPFYDSPKGLKVTLKKKKQFPLASKSDQKLYSFHSHPSNLLGISFVFGWLLKAEPEIRNWYPHDIVRD